MAESVVAQLFLALSIIILASKTAGFLSRRVGQPSMVGAILAGVLLGTGALNLLKLPLFTVDLSAPVSYVAEIGLLLLVFSAGLEVDFRVLGELGRAVLYSGWLGVVLTVILVVPVMLLAGAPLSVALFVGIALAGTGNGVAVQMAFEMNLIRTRVGVVMLGAAMIDDILVFLMLSLLVAFTGVGVDTAGIVLIVVRIVGFVVVAAGVGWFLLPRLTNTIAQLPIDSGPLAFALCAAMLYGWATEAVGDMSPIVGAFIAGLCFANADSGVKKGIQEGVRSLAYSFFVPVFFVNLGLRTDIRQLEAGSLTLVLALLSAAVIAKIVGCGGGARLGGLDTRSALHVGLSLIPRGAVGLAVTAIGLQYHLMPADLFPEIVIVILLTTILAPILVRRFIHRVDMPLSVS